MKTYLIILSIVLTLHPAIASELDQIEQLVAEKIEVVIELLKNQKIDKQERNNKIIEVTMPIIDFERMAKLSLGQKTWNRINNTQKKEFKRIFLKRLQQSYLEKLGRYTDESVIIKKSIRHGNRIQVETDLVTKLGNIEIVYKFLKSQNKWKAYDAEIYGISIVSLYRNQFYYYLKFNTFDSLIEKLKKQSLNL